MPLMTWCILLGTMCCALGGFIVAAPRPATAVLKAFPRHTISGYVLSTIGWCWAAYALANMDLDIINPYKGYLPIAVLICIPLTWYWMDNLLSCRALGAVLMLYPYEMLHVARIHASDARLVLVWFAYIGIVAGMILMLYPWKLRQAIAWLTAQPVRVRLAGVTLAALGGVIVGVGVTFLKG